MHESSCEIRMYLHCRMCSETKPRGLPMARWARIAAGLTSRGMQLWCERHDAEIATIDFDQIDGWIERLPDDSHPVDCEMCRRLGFPRKEPS